MSLKIRLKDNKDIILIDSRRRHRYLVRLGFVNNDCLYLDLKEFGYWIFNGARMSARIYSMMRKAGIAQVLDKSCK